MMPLDIFYPTELPMDISDNIKEIMETYPEMSRDNIEYVAVYANPPVEISIDELLELSKRVQYHVGSSYEFKIHFKPNWNIYWEPEDNGQFMTLTITEDRSKPSMVGHLKSLSTKDGVKKLKTSILCYAMRKTKDVPRLERKSATDEFIKRIIKENHLEEYYEED